MSSPPQRLHWLADLTAFDAGPHQQPFSLSSRARWSAGALWIRYELQGPLDSLVLPMAPNDPVQTEGQRRDGLWQSTCFEAFLALPGCSDYWELNLNPAGEWNLYRLDAYRSGLRPESRVEHVASNIRADASQLVVMVTVPLTACIPANEPLELSATAVLEHRHGGCSYWAWRHCGHQADFHHRDSLMAGDWISAD